MIPKRAGGPGDFRGRLQRLESFESEGISVDAYAFQEAVLRWQLARSGEIPQPDSQPLAELLLDETRLAIEELASVSPGPMQEAASLIDGVLVEAWLANRLVSPPAAMWLRVGSAPVLEGIARAAVDSADADRSLCPVCEGMPQISAIVEESGEFMQGSPRYLICSRCAFWWRFARATCPTCGEHDPKQLGSYRADAWPWARIDSCQTCNSYIKTFDLRERGAGAVVPLVDDFATIALDLWAQERALRRRAPSLAGV